MDKIERSIRFELMVVIAICFAISFVFYGFMNNAMRQENRVANIQYNYDEIKHSAENYVNRIQYSSAEADLNEESFFDELFQEINNNKNNELYNEYSELTEAENNVIFGGRLGEYKYYDMDKVIEVALDKVKEVFADI